MIRKYDDRLHAQLHRTANALSWALPLAKRTFAFMRAAKVITELSFLVQPLELYKGLTTSTKFVACFCSCPLKTVFVILAL